jgi:hypothetical protein
MSLCWKSVLCVAALSLPALPAAAQNQHEMTFHTVPPCTVFDTRVAGGAFAANETRTYNVVGTGSLAAQGGSASGCGVPGFSNGIAQVQAVALTLTSVSATGTGYIAANAADESMAGAVVNFATGSVLTNTSQVAVAQTSSVGDFKVFVAFNGSHVLGRVVGYYMKPVQTVHVHPVPGDATASGTALINAVAGITNASATKRYVVKIEPGIYDVGSTGLLMKQYVDLEGSGQKATVIQGAGFETIDDGVIEGANEAEIRDLQVHCAATTQDVCVAVYLPDGAHTTLRNVTLLANGGSSNYGVRAAGGSPLIEEATIRVSDGSTNYGIVGRGQSNLAVKRTVIEVTNESTGYGMFFTVGSTPREVRDVQITVSGESNNAYGIFFDFDVSAATRITASTVHAEGGFSNTYGIQGTASSLIVEQSQVRALGLNGIGIQAASLSIDHTEVTGSFNTVLATIGGNITGTSLNGGASLGATCAGVWDETPAFFAGPACP